MNMWRYEVVQLLSQHVKDHHTNRKLETFWQGKPLVKKALSAIIRRRLTLEFLIELFGKPKEYIEPWVFASLLLGLWELLFTETPEYAAIYEAVEVAKRKGKRKGGFVNALLRKVLRHRKEVLPSRQLGKQYLPLGKGKCWVWKKGIFPSFEEKPLAYLRLAYSYPYWLIRRLKKHYGLEATIELLEAGNSTPPLYGRLHPSATESHWETLREEGIQYEKTEHPDVIRFLPPFSLEKTALFEKGMVYVQDLHNVVVLDSLLPETPPQRILDVGTAPGGKLLQLLGRYPEADFVAVDSSEERLQQVRENCERVGASVELYCQDIREVPAGQWGEFDLVVVDVPCSNTGVLCRRPQVRWRMNGEKVQELVALQREMVAVSFKHVKKGGFLLYLSCSILPEENEAHEETFLSLGLEKVRECKRMPREEGGDGIFGTLWRKTS